MEASKLIRIKQLYVPYWQWEEWINGMYRNVHSDFEWEMIRKTIAFISDYEKFGTAMERVIIEWPRTMLNAFTNPSINKRAFLGQCAVQFEINCPEWITRQAWGKISEQERNDANKIADVLINEWVIDFYGS